MMFMSNTARQADFSNFLLIVKHYTTTQLHCVQPSAERDVVNTWKYKMSQASLGHRLFVFIDETNTPIVLGTQT